MPETTSKDDELFDAINRTIEAEHAHFINKLKPIIMPLIKQYGDQREQDIVRQYIALDRDYDGIDASGRSWRDLTRNLLKDKQENK